MNDLKIPCFLILFLFFSVSFAGTIQTGRPGQSIGAGIVPSEFIQIQSGVESVQTKSNGETSTSLLNNNVFRTGINLDFEVSAVLDVTKPEDEESETQNAQVGGRYSLLKGETSICFQSRVQIIDGTSKFPKNAKFVNILATVISLSD